jgi:hypothetical protein
MVGTYFVFRFILCVANGAIGSDRKIGEGLSFLIISS